MNGVLLLPKKCIFIASSTGYETVIWHCCRQHSCWITEIELKTPILGAFQEKVKKWKQKILVLKRKLLNFAFWKPWFSRDSGGCSLKSITLAREIAALRLPSERLRHARASTVAPFALNTCKTWEKHKVRTCHCEECNDAAIYDSRKRD